MGRTFRGNDKGKKKKDFLKFRSQRQQKRTVVEKKKKDT